MKAFERLAWTVTIVTSNADDDLARVVLCGAMHDNVLRLTTIARGIRPYGAARENKRRLVGRPILCAPGPVAAARALPAEMENA